MGLGCMLTWQIMRKARGILLVFVLDAAYRLVRMRLGFFCLVNLRRDGSKRDRLGRHHVT